MYLAVKAVGKLYLLEVGVLDPVLPVASAAEGYHNLVSLGSVACEAMDFGDWLIDVENIGEFEGSGRFAGPTRQAFFPAESHSGQLHDFL